MSSPLDESIFSYAQEDIPLKKLLKIPPRHRKQFLGSRVKAMREKARNHPRLGYIPNDRLFLKREGFRRLERRTHPDIPNGVARFEYWGEFYWRRGGIYEPTEMERAFRHMENK